MISLSKPIKIFLKGVQKRLIIIILNGMFIEDQEKDNGRWERVKRNRKVRVRE